MPTRRTWNGVPQTLDTLHRNPARQQEKRAKLVVTNKGAIDAVIRQDNPKVQ